MATPKPSLHLFFSVDFIDSTAFKSKVFLQKELDPSWSTQFLALRDDFSSDYLAQFNHLKKGYEPTILEAPKVWKMLGDEVVFSVKILDINTLWVYIETLMHAIDVYNDSGERALEIKGTAWLVETPVSNTYINMNIVPAMSIESHSSSILEMDNSFDIIGPSMDIGFRIAKFSSARKLAISIELAYALTKETPTNHKKFYFDGLKLVKGVLEHHKYPVIWLDIYDGNDPDDIVLLGINRSATSREMLNKYCKEYLEKYPIILQSYKIPTLDDKKYKDNYDIVLNEVYNNNKNEENEEDGDEELALPEKDKLRLIT